MAYPPVATAPSSKLWQALSPLAALLLVVGCPAAPATDAGVEEAPRTLSGGFHGLAQCPNVERQIDLMLSQQVDDNDVDGRVFVDWNVQYVDGLVNIVLAHVVAGELVGGELDGDAFSGLVLTETVDGRASAPDFSLHSFSRKTRRGIAPSRGRSRS